MKILQQFTSSVFDYDAHVTTYAVGPVSQMVIKIFPGRMMQGKGQPGTEMADNWDVMVKAFEMRLDYSLADWREQGN